VEDEKRSIKQGYQKTHHLAKGRGKRQKKDEHGRTFEWGGDQIRVKNSSIGGRKTKMDEAGGVKGTNQIGRRGIRPQNGT